MVEDVGRVEGAGVVDASSGAEVGLGVLCHVERAGRAVWSLLEYRPLLMKLE